MAKRKKNLKILLIGHMGQIGWELNRSLQTLGHVVALDFPDIDLAKSSDLREKIRAIKPGLIVNAAAYTTVDRAEDEPELAQQINAHAPSVIAQEAESLNAALVHYSTDYVFDGKNTLPYKEDDRPNPLNTYGRTKLEGDRLILSKGIPCLILRTSWVYGRRGKNFMLTILKLAMEKQEIRVVNDQIGSPNWSRMLAEATTNILAQGIEDPVEFLKTKGGLYNLSAHGETSWFAFAEAILKNDLRRDEHILKRIIPISTEEYPTPARRPLHSTLSTKAIEDSFGINLPNWEDILKLVLTEN